MKIERTKAVALFVALGLKNADKWNDQRMGSKLSRIKDMVDEDVQLEDEEKATLAEIMAALDAGEEIEVTRPDSEPEGEPMGSGQAADDASSAEKEAAKAERAAKKAERAAKKAEKAANRQPRSRRGRARLRACGQVLREMGMVDGSFALNVDSDMIKRVNDIVGKPNDEQTKHSIDQAWSALAGYFEDGKEAS